MSLSELRVIARERNIGVVVNPPCMSGNRQAEYMYEALGRYITGSLTDNMAVLESDGEVTIVFNR